MAAVKCEKCGAEFEADSAGRTLCEQCLNAEKNGEAPNELPEAARTFSALFNKAGQLTDEQKRNYTGEKANGDEDGDEESASEEENAEAPETEADAETPETADEAEADGEKQSDDAKDIYSRIMAEKHTPAERPPVRVSPERQARIEAIRKRKRKKKIIAASAAAGVLLALVIVVVTVFVPASQYGTAVALYQSGEYEQALELFGKLDTRKDSEAYYRQTATAYGDRYLEQGDEINAAICYTKAGRTLEAEQIFDFNTMVMGYSYVSAAISQKGNTYYLTNRADDNAEEGQKAVSSMSAFIPSAPGINGVDPMGAVVQHALNGSLALKLTDTTVSQLNMLTGVEDIISESRPNDGQLYNVVLLKNGTVNVISEMKDPITSTAAWKNIASITDGSNKIFALDYSGQLYIAYETPAEPAKQYNVSDWPVLRKVVETGKALIGLTVTGELRIAYQETNFQYDFDFASAKNVIDIAADNNVLLILYEDGTVDAIRVPNWLTDEKSAQTPYVGRILRTVGRWKNIIRIRFAANGIYGIRKDGKVRFMSADISYEPETGKYQFDRQSKIRRQVARWRDVTDVISCTTHSIAIKTDGTAEAAGDGTYLAKKSTSISSDSFRLVPQKDGVYTNVKDWVLW